MGRALVPGALLVALGFVDALGDVGRLLVDAGQDAAGFVVEAVMGAGVADLADRVADDLLEIGVALRGDLAGDEHHAGRGYRLAGDAALGVLGQQGVEDGVRDLVADFVGVSIGDRFRREEMFAVLTHGRSLLRGFLIKVTDKIP